MLRILIALLVSAAPLLAETLEQALADTLHPYTGQTSTAGAVDRSTLTGQHLANFIGSTTHPDEIAHAWSVGTRARLRALKSTWDPENVFRIGHVISPATTSTTVPVQRS